MSDVEVVENRFSLRFEVAGIALVIEYDFGKGAWFLRYSYGATRDATFEIGKKPKSLATNRALELIQKVILYEKCGWSLNCRKKLASEIPVNEIRDKIRNFVEYVERVPLVAKMTPNVEVPWGTYVNLPMWGDDTISMALVVSNMLDVFVVHDEKPKLIELSHAYAEGIYERRWFLLPLYPAFKPLRQAKNLVELERALYEGILPELMHEVVGLPKYEDVLYWWKKVRTNPLTWLKWWVNVAREYMEEVLEHNAVPTDLNLLELVLLAYLFSPIFDYWPRVVFKAPRGTAAYLHMLVKHLPYVRLWDTFTNKVTDVLLHIRPFTHMNFFATIANDSLETFKRVYMSNVKRLNAFVTGGVALGIGYTPFIDELISKVPTMRILVQTPMPKRWSIWQGKVPDLPLLKWRGRTPEGDKIEIAGSDNFQPITVALFLALSRHVYQVYKKINGSTSNNVSAWWGELPLQFLNVYQPLIVMAELLGKEYIETIVKYAKSNANG